MFKKISQLLGADPHQRKVDDLKEIVHQINALEPEYEAVE
jgi:preprotein translocase subunit SecA